VYRMHENKEQWYHVKHHDPATLSRDLNEYISCYSSKQTQGDCNDVVKYRDLRLNVLVTNNKNNKTMFDQQFKVKVMKEEYFKKIRTATPKKTTQPLNFTYPRFWVEILKDQVYLCVVDSRESKEYSERKNGPRRPINSVIGAYVDNRMQVELAMMSSFRNTDIEFEWFVRSDYLNKWFMNGINFQLRLTGNNEMSDWMWGRTLVSEDMRTVSMKTENERITRAWNDDVFVPHEPKSGVQHNSGTRGKKRKWHEIETDWAAGALGVSTTPIKEKWNPKMDPFYNKLGWKD